MSYNIPGDLKGLTEKEVLLARNQFGYNRIESVRHYGWVYLLVSILKEPMLILLLTVGFIYVILGDYEEAVFMFIAIAAVTAISFYQDNRSKKALQALEKLNEPLSKVLREGQVREIPTYEIVSGDLCITEEGKTINADGEIVYSHDFSVNESSLTGESFSVFKDNKSENNLIYSGTVTVSGLAVFKVQKIGKETRIGKIGQSILDIHTGPSLLQLQVANFVRSMAIVGVIVVLAVCAVNYYHTQNFIKSLLNGLTLAMSILPEEIPVALTTFMALGAWRLMKEGIIIKKSNIVETLGSTTVICTDKTGTITENSMQLKMLYNYRTDRIYHDNEYANTHLNELISYAMWSSEPIPFDPMEKTLHHVYEQTQNEDLRTAFHLFHEYPLEGKPPMMTHIFENTNKERIIASKGAAEAILGVCCMIETEKERIMARVKKISEDGYRVLGVAKADFEGYNFPGRQQDFKFIFLGLTVFFDPPKKGIKEVFKSIYDAGIKVKVITGDNNYTTGNIAAQAGIVNKAATIIGTDLMGKDKATLLKIADNAVLFTRMFPEAKLAVINALKENGEIVAMMGDGVNDGPALKAAHIGVAMGGKGTEIAKAAATLVLTNDDLGKLVTGIAAGRRIYANLKKAVRYIIAIHIPIILTVSLPLFLNWVFPQIFTPVHVIFLELIMGPTCSIVYENEPMEKNTMQQPPRLLTDTFLNWRELSMSILQGLIITIGVLAVYQIAIQNGCNEEKTRAMVFSSLVFANILLSFTNRSFYYSVFQGLKNKNTLLVAITMLVLVLLLAILYITPVAQFFKVTKLSIFELSICFGVAVFSVWWFELYKWMKRNKTI